MRIFLGKKTAEVGDLRAALLARDYRRADAIAKSLPARLGPFNNLFGRIHVKALEATAALEPVVKIRRERKQW